MFGKPVSAADAPLKHHGTGGAPRPGYDVFGNSVAIASLSEPSAELRIESDLALETYTAERPPFEVTPEALSYPFIIRPTTASTSAGCLNGSIPIATIGSDPWRPSSSPAITKE